MPTSPDPLPSKREAVLATRSSIRLMVLAMAAFTLNDTLVKLASESVPTGQLIFLRGVLATTFVLLAVRIGLSNGPWPLAPAPRKPDQGPWSRPAGFSPAPPRAPPERRLWIQAEVAEDLLDHQPLEITATPPFPQPNTTTTNTFTETTTYVGNETVTVFGCSFSPCKFVRNTVPGNGVASTSSTVWRVLGKGVVVRLESTSAGTTTVLQLKSGSLNGVAL